MPGVCSPKPSCPNGQAGRAATVSRLEHGGEANISTVRKLARALRVSPHELTETDQNDRQAAINPSNRTPRRRPNGPGLVTCRGGHMAMVTAPAKRRTGALVPLDAETTALIYSRVSRDEQADEGVSLPAQVAEARTVQRPAIRLDRR